MKYSFELIDSYLDHKYTSKQLLDEMVFIADPIRQANYFSDYGDSYRIQPKTDVSQVKNKMYADMLVSAYINLSNKTNTHVFKTISSLLAASQLDLQQLQSAVDYLNSYTGKIQNYKVLGGELELSDKDLCVYLGDDRVSALKIVKVK